MPATGRVGIFIAKHMGALDRAVVFCTKESALRLTLKNCVPDVRCAWSCLMISQFRSPTALGPGATFCPMQSLEGRAVIHPKNHPHSTLPMPCLTSGGRSGLGPGQRLRRCSAARIAFLSYSLSVPSRVCMGLGSSTAPFAEVP